MPVSSSGWAAIESMPHRRRPRLCSGTTTAGGSLREGDDAPRPQRFHRRQVTIRPATRDPSATEDDRASAWTSMRTHSFGPASELPYRRRVSDWIRLVVGTGLVLGLLQHQDNESPFELDIFRTIHDLPRAAESAVWMVYPPRAVWGPGPGLLPPHLPPPPLPLRAPAPPPPPPARPRRPRPPPPPGPPSRRSPPLLTPALVAGSSFSPTLAVSLPCHHAPPKSPAVQKEDHTSDLQSNV